MSEVVESGRRTTEHGTAVAESLDPWVVPLSAIARDPDVDDAVAETIRSGWWSSGPRVAELELAFASMCGSGEAVAVANGTAALHLALLAVGCGPGDEVVLPSLNFVAAANVIGHVGATAVFCDISSEHDLTIDPADLEAAVTSNTRAVVVMHYGGHPCAMEAILDIACRHGLAVIEDAAHAPGATLAGRPCGTFGKIGCFSFFSNKNLPTGEGGMVVTRDEELADRLRLLRSHGMTTLSWDRHRGHAQSYDVLLPGFNYRMDDLRAAIGIVQLRRLVERNAARGRIVAAYRDALDGYRGIRMPFPTRDGTRPAHHLAVIILPDGWARDEFRAALTAARIQTSVHYPPTHRLSWYRARSRRRPLPVTDAVSDRLVTLPLYPHMGAAAVRAVIDAVRGAVR
jgi:dTDP-4-amino-4,6-dideoxygalactose transaminase